MSEADAQEEWPYILYAQEEWPYILYVDEIITITADEYQQLINMGATPIYKDDE